MYFALYQNTYAIQDHVLMYIHEESIFMYFNAAEGHGCTTPPSGVRIVQTLFITLMIIQPISAREEIVQ
uniref:Uncharacterized protein n=1 Tax=Anguilla anguilla TaxID=7936 RepID=A0A0E9Q3Z2_ANGAN